MKKLIINLGFILGVSTMVVGCTDYLDSDYLLRNVLTLRMCFKVRTIPMNGWQRIRLYEARLSATSEQ